MQAALIPISEDELDDGMLIDSMPQDMECSACYIIKDDYVECPQCRALSCVECITDHSKRQNNGEHNPNKFHCMMCRKVGPMNPMNKILKDILLHLRFVCPE